MTPVDATRQAMKEVSGPVVAIALILCAVFVPVAFMGGVTGALYQQFAITIAVAVVFSAINALTLSPALSAMLLRPPKPGRGPVAWFFKKFNDGFNRATNAYGTVVGALTRKAARSMLLLVVVLGGIYGLGKFVPGGFIPDEDKGYIFVAIELPEGASLQRSDAVLRQVEEIVYHTEGVRSAIALSGFNVLNSLSFPNSALMFVGLEDWEERKDPALHAQSIIAELNRKFYAIPGARVFCFGPPPLPGYGSVSGFTMQLQDRAGGTVEDLAGYVERVITAASQRREIGRVTSTFQPVTPQVRVDLDREKARTLVNVSKMSGRNFVTRFNFYLAAEMMGAPAPGYSSAQALTAMEEVMAEMPANIGYEWSGLTLQQKKSEGQAPLILGMAVDFVFLLLAAQYESWTLPFAFILGCVPLMLASGSGAASRSTMGTGVVFGMSIATLIGIFLIPVCYVFVEKLNTRRNKRMVEAANDPSISTGDTTARLRPTKHHEKVLILTCDWPACLLRDRP